MAHAIALPCGPVSCIIQLFAGMDSYAANDFDHSRGDRMVSIFLKRYLKNKHSTLLLVMLLIVAFLPFIEKFMNTNVPLVSLIFLAGLTITIWSINLPKKIFLTFVTISALICLLELALKVLPPGEFRIDIALITWLIYAMFLLGCIVIMMARLLRAVRVSSDTIVGGINIYFLMAFLWALLYHIINLINPAAFNVRGKIDITRLLYYSYNTITTLGNGDIVPVNRFAMILSSLEAIVGQLFLAIFVATLVGLHISNKTSHTGR